MTSSSRWILSDPDFRSVVNVAPTAKRDYLSTIRAAVAKKVSHLASEAREQEGGVVWLWLFSLREDRSALLSVEVAEAVGAR